MSNDEYQHQATWVNPITRIKDYQILYDIIYDRIQRLLEEELHKQYNGQL
jgi:hypothetical protein